MFLSAACDFRPGLGEARNPGGVWLSRKLKSTSGLPDSGGRRGPVPPRPNPLVLGSWGLRETLARDPLPLASGSGRSEDFQLCSDAVLIISLSIQASPCSPSSKRRTFMYSRTACRKCQKNLSFHSGSSAGSAGPARRWGGTYPDDAALGPCARGACRAHGAHFVRRDRAVFVRRDRAVRHAIDMFVDNLHILVVRADDPALSRAREKLRDWRVRWRRQMRRVWCVRHGHLRDSQRAQEHKRGRSD
jgi:hypothetical protein